MEDKPKKGFEWLASEEAKAELEKVLLEAHEITERNKEDQRDLRLILHLYRPSSLEKILGIDHNTIHEMVIAISNHSPRFLTILPERVPRKNLEEISEFLRK